MIKPATMFLLSGLATVLGAQLACADSGDPAKGKAIYETRCMVCHGAQGKGDGPMGKALKPPPTDFTSPKTKAKSDADLLQVIQNGLPSTTMPAYKGQLSVQEVFDVLAYVQSLSR